MSLFDVLTPSLRQIKARPDDLALEAWHHIRTAQKDGDAVEAELATAKLLLATYLNNNRK